MKNYYEGLVSGILLSVFSYFLVSSERFRDFFGGAMLLAMTSAVVIAFGYGLYKRKKR